MLVYFRSVCVLCFFVFAVHLELILPKNEWRERAKKNGPINLVLKSLFVYINILILLLLIVCAIWDTYQATVSETHDRNYNFGFGSFFFQVRTVMDSLSECWQEKRQLKQKNEQTSGGRKIKLKSHVSISIHVICFPLRIQCI